LAGPAGELLHCLEPDVKQWIVVGTIVAAAVRWLPISAADGKHPIYIFLCSLTVSTEDF
jgi:hypothetical protein